MTKRKHLQQSTSTSMSDDSLTTSGLDRSNHITCKEKKKFLDPYVKQLVEEKMNLKNHKLPRDPGFKNSNTMVNF